MSLLAVGMVILAFTLGVFVGALMCAAGKGE